SAWGHPSCQPSSGTGRPGAPEICPWPWPGGRSGPIHDAQEHPKSVPLQRESLGSWGHHRGDGTGHSDWFLLDSRTVRHAAIGLFCCGVSVYLTALAIYMLLLFELEAGIASACILSSGIIVLLITVTHALVRASRVSRRSRSKVSHTLYENDSAQQGESSTSDLNNKNVAAPRPRPEIHREFSFPPFLEHQGPRFSICI
uniref:Transmembrane protein 221 n=1 Tax=Calidris pygmaea TaxID=425635 RepID=A0A8C3JRQ4_9CHAR